MMGLAILITTIIGAALIIGGLVTALLYSFDKRHPIIIGATVMILIIALSFCWLFLTQQGKAILKSERSAISGINRTVRVYTADGGLIAEYTGKFNIEDENGGIMFDIDGKRHIYWNCFVESIEE